MGQGIGFTKRECEEMWGDLRLGDHMLTVPVPVPGGEGNSNETTHADVQRRGRVPPRVGDSIKVHWPDEGWEGADFDALIVVRVVVAGVHACACRCMCVRCYWVCG
jgi:hypothetical protein